MKVLPTMEEVRGLLTKELASAIGESYFNVSIQIDDFHEENDIYVVTGTFKVVPFIVITRQGRIEASVIQTEKGLRITKLKITGDKE
jgi:hypothetical protein